MRFHYFIEIVLQLILNYSKTKLRHFWCRCSFDSVSVFSLIKPPLAFHWLWLVHLKRHVSFIRTHSLIHTHSRTTRTSVKLCFCSPFLLSFFNARNTQTVEKFSAWRITTRRKNGTNYPNVVLSLKFCSTICRNRYFTSLSKFLCIQNCSECSDENERIYVFTGALLSIHWGSVNGLKQNVFACEFVLVPTTCCDRMEEHEYDVKSNAAQTHW